MCLTSHFDLALLFVGVLFKILLQMILFFTTEFYIEQIPISSHDHDLAQEQQLNLAFEGKPAFSFFLTTLSLILLFVGSEMVQFSKYLSFCQHRQSEKEN